MQTIEAVERKHWPILRLKGDEIQPDDLNRWRLAKGRKILKPPKLKRVKAQNNDAVADAVADEKQAWHDLNALIKASEWQSLQRCHYGKQGRALAALRSRIGSLVVDLSDLQISTPMECWNPIDRECWLGEVKSNLEQAEALTAEIFECSPKGIDIALAALERKVLSLTRPQAHIDAGLRRVAKAWSIIEASPERMRHTHALTNLERVRKGRKPLTFAKWSGIRNSTQIRNRTDDR